MTKTKAMRFEIVAGQVKSSGKYPFGVCKNGVGRNSILCSKRKKWIHRKYRKVENIKKKYRNIEI